MTTEDLPGGIGSRREARERAVELAYAADLRGLTANEVLDTQITTVDHFIVQMLTWAERHRDRAEEIVGDLATGWSVARMPTMDVVIMRLAIGELIESDTPSGVVLNEAVALAKRYSTADSGRFINGILSAAARQIRNGS